MFPQSHTQAECSEEPSDPDSLHFDLRNSGDKFRIAECDVGMGVFARCDLAPGEAILEIGGPIIDFAETKRRGPRECMAIQVGYDRYIDTQPPGVFVNHSCDPNAGIVHDRFLVALRHISRGHEIRFDYSTTMEEQSFTMRCLCGMPECRHVIGDFSGLPDAVKQRYLARGVVMKFISSLHRQNVSGLCAQTSFAVPESASRLAPLSAVQTLG